MGNDGQELRQLLLRPAFVWFWQADCWVEICCAVQREIRSKAVQQKTRSKAVQQTRAGGFRPSSCRNQKKALHMI